MEGFVPPWTGWNCPHGRDGDDDDDYDDTASLARFLVRWSRRSVAECYNNNNVPDSFYTDRPGDCWLKPELTEGLYVVGIVEL